MRTVPELRDHRKKDAVADALGRVKTAVEKHEAIAARDAARRAPAPAEGEGGAGFDAAAASARRRRGRRPRASGVGRL